MSIITPHPKSSGGARWNYLAAWGFALKRKLGDLAKLHDPKYAADVAKAQDKAREFVTDLFRNVKVLDSGARGATMSFVRRGRDDALLAWENEALLTMQEQKAQGKDEMEMVVPSVSILAEPPWRSSMTWWTAAEPGRWPRRISSTSTRPRAKTWPPSTSTARGSRRAWRRNISSGSRRSDMFTVDDVFGGWAKAQAEHFDDGGVLDQMYRSIGGAR